MFTGLIEVVFLLALLLACKRSEQSSSSPATAQPAAEPALPTMPTSASEAPTAPPAAPVDVDEKGIPAIPDGRSGPPTVAEWSAAPSVNTQETNSQAKDCHMKIVREWLKVHCEGDVRSISDQDGLPKSTADMYQSVVNGKFADFVIRLKKGSTMKMRIHRDGNRASLFVNWPGAKDRPVHVALAQIAE
jgi:hypothetical protein